MKLPPFTEELVPAGSVPEKLYMRTLRRRIRYVLSRLKTEVDGGEEMSAPEGFKEFFEKQDDWWDGWENWGVTWDVGALDQEGPLVVVPRWTSIHEEWDEVVEAELKSNEIAARKRRRMGNGSQGDI